MHRGSTVCGIFQEYNAHELQGFVVNGPHMLRMWCVSTHVLIIKFKYGFWG